MDENALIEHVGTVFKGRPFELQRGEDPENVFLCLSPKEDCPDVLAIDLLPLYFGGSWVFRPVLGTKFGIEFLVSSGDIAALTLPGPRKSVHLLLFFEPTISVEPDILEAPSPLPSLWQRLAGV